jgi:hypothetical protein
MSRYATNSILRNNDGMRRFTTSIIPVMPVSNKDVYIQTTSIERLDKLANIFYDDSTLWWVIATANGLGKGTIVVPKNVKLRIPSIDNMQQIINNINNTR